MDKRGRSRDTCRGACWHGARGPTSAAHAATAHGHAAHGHAAVLHASRPRPARSRLHLSIPEATQYSSWVIRRHLSAARARRHQRATLSFSFAGASFWRPPSAELQRQARERHCCRAKGICYCRAKGFVVERLIAKVERKRIESGPLSAPGGALRTPQGGGDAHLWWGRCAAHRGARPIGGRGP